MAVANDQVSATRARHAVGRRTPLDRGRQAGEPGRALRPGRAAAARFRRSRSTSCRSPTRPTARSNADKSNAVLVCHALTGDQHVASVNPVTGKPGWWALMVGPGQADRHRPLLRHLRQRARRLHGDDRPGLDQSGDRPRLRPRPAGHHRPRHGAGAGDAARPARHRDAVLACSAARWAACRCCNGRRAIPERVFSALPIAARRAPLVAEHRLPRGRPPGGHGRSRTGAAADTSSAGTQPAQGPRRRAHGGAHHLPVRRGAAPEVRPQAAGPRQADLRLRRGLPDRVLSPPPGHRPSSTASTPTPIST